MPRSWPLLTKILLSIVEQKFLCQDEWSEKDEYSPGVKTQEIDRITKSHIRMWKIDQSLWWRKDPFK